MAIEAIHNVLAEAAADALHKVNAVAREQYREVHDDGGEPIDINLYVYPNGVWLIDNPQYLQDHNTLAQAPIIEYANVKALIAALGETVADD